MPDAILIGVNYGRKLAKMYTHIHKQMKNTHKKKTPPLNKRYETNKNSNHLNEQKRGREN